MIVSGDNDGIVKVWDLTAGKMMQEFTVEGGSEPVSPSLAYLFVCCWHIVHVVVLLRYPVL